MRALLCMHIIKCLYCIIAVVNLMYLIPQLRGELLFHQSRCSHRVYSTHGLV